MMVKQGDGGWICLKGGQNTVYAGCERKVEINIIHARSPVISKVNIELLLHAQLFKCSAGSSHHKW